MEDHISKEENCYIVGKDLYSGIDHIIKLIGE
jgi:hypothetical protein